MVNLHRHEVERWRDISDHIRSFYGNTGDETCGIFVVPSPIDGKGMRVVASSGGGWDHVSVSRANRCPTWIEMEYVKRYFFAPHEVAMQLHVRPSEHLSLHSYCLHIWRPNDGREIPMPPAIMVAPPDSAIAAAPGES
jgi:hypothetical protein